MQQQPSHDGPGHPVSTTSPSSAPPDASSSSKLANATESWTAPQDSEGEYVRKTYLHFDRFGIGGDGMVEGKEWTRNRTAGETPWAASSMALSKSEIPPTSKQSRSSTSNSSLRQRDSNPHRAVSEGLVPPSSSSIRRPPRSLSRPNSGATTPGGLTPSSSGGGLSARDSSFRPDTSSSLLGPISASSSVMQPSSSGQLSRSHSNASQSSILVPSEVMSEMGSEEWHHQRQVEQSKRATLESGTLGRQGSRPFLAVDGDESFRSRQIEKENDLLAETSGQLDRYGFFEGGEGGSQLTRDRVVILPAACFDYVPTPNGSSSGSKARAAASKAMCTLQDCDRRFERTRAVSGTRRSSLVANGEKKAGGEPAPASSSSAASVISSLRSRAEQRDRAKEQNRIDKWSAMLAPSERQGANATSFKIRDSARPKLESRVFKGVPDRWRSAVWWSLTEEKYREGRKRSGSKSEHELAAAATAGSGGVQRDLKSTSVASPGVKSDPAGVSTTDASTTQDAGGLIRRLSMRPKKRRDRSHTQTTVTPASKDPSKDLYSHLLSLSSPHDVQIDLDVPRTINNHVLFYTRYGMGQRNLFKTLHCFSLVCGECGYCQGMGSLAVSLLCYYEEERAFEMMRRLHSPALSHAWSLHQTFRPGFPGLMEFFYVQGKLLKLLCPQVAELLEAHGVATSSYATRWYITLFYNVVPFETQLRLWDAVLLKGSRDVLPLFGVAILHAVSMTKFFPPAAPTKRSAMTGRKSQGNPLTHSDSNEAGTGQGRAEQPPSTTSTAAQQQPLDFESILSTLSSSNLFVPEDDEAMLRWVGALLRDRSVQREMERARVEWAGIVQRGEEGSMML